MTSPSPAGRQNAQQLTTPVAFFVFNRPELTAKVFEQIRRARPKQLFVIADGPRREDETERCRKTRAIATAVDWDCEVLTDFSDKNLGCGKRVSSGIDWVLSQVEDTIILEDDCVPSDSFFPFCQTILNRYRDDDRVMHVSGTNVQFDRVRSQDSYFFSRYNLIWGWATWRRAWRFYDFKMTQWPEFLRRDGLRDVCDDDFEAENWKERFASVYEGRLDTWDYQWTFSCWTQNGLTVVPQKNLVTNLGFGADATHTNSQNVLSYLDAKELDVTDHPPFVTVNHEADKFIIDYVLGRQAGQGGLNRLRYLAWRLMTKLRSERVKTQHQAAPLAGKRS